MATRDKMNINFGKAHGEIDFQWQTLYENILQTTSISTVPRNRHCLQYFAPSTKAPSTLHLQQDWQQQQQQEKQSRKTFK